MAFMLAPNPGTTRSRATAFGRGDPAHAFAARKRGTYLALVAAVDRGSPPIPVRCASDRRSCSIMRLP